MRTLKAVAVIQEEPTKDNEVHRSEIRFLLSFFYGLRVEFLFTQTVLLFIVATIHLYAS
jgi:hypothetical protein